MTTARSLAGCRVLVIEDEYFLAMELMALLEEHGAQVIGPLGNVEQALQQVVRDGFEVAVIDINLQGAESYSCADELKRQNVPFVFASAYHESHIPSRFSDVHLWEKPYNHQSLIEDITRLCASRIQT